MISSPDYRLVRSHFFYIELKKYGYILLISIIVLAFGLRSYKLTDRPLHTDEAVGAVKFGQLLDHGDYTYDPFEYHGPTMNYLTLIPAWIVGEDTFKDLSIGTIRSVALFFGMLLVLIPIVFLYRFDFRYALLVSFLVTVSPAMIFYSRYYIHEFILVFFTFLGIYAYFQWEAHRKWLWSALLGFSVGMMIATKETWIISVAGFLAAVVVAGNRQAFYQFLVSKHSLIALGLMLVVIVTFFSSFFTHFEGLKDMSGTYSTYLDRAGTKDLHRHPWYYYLELLSFNKGSEYFWSEVSIILLAATGSLFLYLEPEETALVRNLRMIEVFSVFLLIIYSILPYKTPWNLLSFYMGLFFLAGYGLINLIWMMGSRWAEVAVALIFGLICIHLLSQSFIEYRNPADPSNPWVYGHTDGNFHQVVQTIDSVAMDESTYIEVVFPGHGYWPFPWYLKKYSQVAYRDKVDFNSPGGEIILIAPSQEGELVEKLYEKPPPGERFLYLNLFDSTQTLRPNVYFNGYQRQDLWEKRQNINIEND
ncbi:MAG: TIGR03663 family protein [Cyclobacteriaceae bacterium]